MDKSARLQIFLGNCIYFVTGEQFSLGRSDADIVEEVLRGGVRVVQLRDKVSSMKKLMEKARQLRKLTHQYGALLLINDHVDIALVVGADGVHLGQDDLPLEQVRKIDPANSQNMIFGLSTHNLEEINEVEQTYKNFQQGKNTAQSLPDYINIGPLFATDTKQNSYPAIVKDEININNLQTLFQAISLPFTVMGGVKYKHLSTLVAIGVKHFAMITEITKNPHPENMVRKMIAMVNHGQ